MVSLSPRSEHQRYVLEQITHPSILANIISFVPLKNLPSIMRVSSALYELASPYCYQHVAIPPVTRTGSRSHPLHALRPVPVGEPGPVAKIKTKAELLSSHLRTLDLGDWRDCALPGQLFKTSMPKLEVISLRHTQMRSPKGTFHDAVTYENEWVWDLWANLRKIFRVASPTTLVVHFCAIQRHYRHQRDTMQIPACVNHLVIAWSCPYNGDQYPPIDMEWWLPKGSIDVEVISILVDRHMFRQDDPFDDSTPLSNLCFRLLPYIAGKARTVRLSGLESLSGAFWRPDADLGDHPTLDMSAPILMHQLKKSLLHNHGWLNIAFGEVKTYLDKVEVMSDSEFRSSVSTVIWQCGISEPRGRGWNATEAGSG